MIVATACRVDERKFAGFFLLNVIRYHLSLGHELWLWKKSNLPDRVSATALLTLLTVCYLYPTSGSKNHPKILAHKHLLINQICILVFYLEPKYFLLIDF